MDWAIIVFNSYMYYKWSHSINFQYVHDAIGTRHQCIPWDDGNVPITRENTLSMKVIPAAGKKYAHSATTQQPCY